MQIANQVGVGSSQRAAPEFTVTLGGLKDNPTHGLSAERASTLRAQASGPEGVTLGSPSYQWQLNGASIAGATGQNFVVAPGLPDLGVISCAVTIGAQTRVSPDAILREVPPAVQGSLQDEVFDHDTGPQTIPAASVFGGNGLHYTVTGAGASIDAATGDVVVPTSDKVAGVVITVSASNSGGTASAAFQVTVEETVSLEGAVPFGALTPAGVGGVPVSGASITSGDPAGHWQINGGRLTPSAAGAGSLAGVYTLGFDTGAPMTITIEADKASARPEELATVFGTLPETARGLLVQDGDARSVGRQRLEAKAFTGEMILEPTNWVEHEDPRQSVRPVTLAGLTIGGDPSNNEQLRMENLTVQGFICQAEQGTGESEAGNGIVLVERPSRHVTIRQNEIWSRRVAEIVAANDFRDNLKTSRQLRGIATKVYRGLNEHIRIEENHIHDVSRGAGLVGCNAYQGIRSRLCDNIIEDCYTNFFTCGYLDGLDIFDNRCMGVYAANGDTLGAIPATSPHSACGGSFDAGGSRSTQNVSMIGNLFHTGWLRTQLHETQGLSKPAIGATGIKFNDPSALDSYWNLDVGFNTVISHGICMEMSGAGADQHIDVFHNTLASESYAGTGSGPVYYFVGADKVRLWNNIGTAYTIGSLDNENIFSRTLDTLQGYGNLKINTGSHDLGENSYFTGIPNKGLEKLTLDEASIAYVPRPTTGAALGVPKRGAQGTGLYRGNGDHTATFAKPAPSGGIDDVPVFTTWNGGAYMQYTGSRSMLNVASRRRAMLFAWEGQFAASTDGKDVVLFCMKDGRIQISKSKTGALSLSIKNINSGVVCRANSSFRISATAGLVRLALSYDVDSGRVHFVKNGVLDDFATLRELSVADIHVGSNPVRINANHLSTPGQRFEGQFGRAYWTPEFVDLESEAGLNKLYTQTGAFRDFGADGSAVTGTPAMVYIRGDAGSLGNLGNGGNFALTGSVT